MTVLSDIITLLEVDVEDYGEVASDATSYQNVILQNINNGVSFLKSNNIPFLDTQIAANTSMQDLVNGGINSGDYGIIIEWLYMFVLQRFDSSTMAINRYTSTYINWVESRMTELLYSLKSRYDNNA